MEYRFAAQTDVPVLATMNQQLIHDEGHRNPMTLPELAQRMARWLQGEYTAVIFHENGNDLGYVLYKCEPDWVYLRQFFVHPDHRRKGIGRAAMQWLIANRWADAPRLRVEVLVRNAPGIAFWQSLGFADYCITLELESPRNST